MIDRNSRGQRLAHLLPPAHLSAVALLALGLLAAPPGPAAASGAARPPNIVLVFTDDQRADTLGCMGNPLAATPQIDRLAAEGALFERAFVITSLCCPSRATVLTGQYSHIHAVSDNALDLEYDRGPFLPRLLKQLGYATAFIGKYHLGGLEASATPRPYFDHWAGMQGQGRHTACPLNINGKMTRPSGYATDVLARMAVDWIEAQEVEPFFLLLSLKSPHGPMLPARRHRRLFADAVFAVPDSFRDPPLGLPGPIQALRMSARPFRKTAAELRELSLGYARMIPAIDDAVGRLYAALAKRRIIDRTLFIFSSDNGHLFGEHEIIAKGLAYDPSIHVPMIVRYPPLFAAGTRLTQQVLNLDLAPTILEAAGGQVPETMQGMRLSRLGRAGDGGWRRDWLYVGNHAAGDSPTHLAVRSDRWKYVRYRDGGISEQLFDLLKDPGERHNLAPLPAHKTQLRARRGRMLELMRRLQVPRAWWQATPGPQPD